MILSLALACALATPVFANDKPGEGVTLRPVIQPVIEEKFQARIIFRALQDLGYTVAEPEEILAQTAHLAVGTGDADFFTDSWNALHDAFYQEAGGDKVMTKVGTLVEGGLIPPGTVLTDTKRRWKAKVRVDGSLECDGQPAGSIHKVGAGVQGAPSCNGWTFWHVDTGQDLRVIDAVRQDWLLANEA
jgi:hypothetical protein